MKTQKLIRSLVIMTVITTLSLGGCKKDKTDNDQRAAVDNATAENAFNDVFQQVDKAAKQTAEAGGKGTMLLDSGGCATVTITPFDTFNFPKTITIDFGPTNCLGTDGRYRRGKIISVITGKYRDSSTVITVNPDQYYVNDNLIQGTKTITNLGHVGTYGGGHNLKYSIVVSNASITTNEGTISWNSTRTREWIEGESTHWPNWTDDVYLIDGSASGTDVNGNTFNITITSALRCALNCHWIESGTMDVTPSGKPTRTVDFGNGDCDNQATVTINGVVYNITMH